MLDRGPGGNFCMGNDVKKMGFLGAGYFAQKFKDVPGQEIEKKNDD